MRVIISKIVRVTCTILVGSFTGVLDLQASAAWGSNTTSLHAEWREGHRPSDGWQVVFFKCLDLHRTSPGFAERPYKSWTGKRRFDHALEASGGVYTVHRQSPVGPVDHSFRALCGRLKFTVRRHKFNKILSPLLGAGPDATASGVYTTVSPSPTASGAASSGARTNQGAGNGDSITLWRLLSG